MEQVQSILVMNEENVTLAEDRKKRFSNIKNEIKKEAKELRALKLDLKDCQRGTHKGAGVSQGDVANAKWEWRHKHIAYCILRGRSYEEVENYVREENAADRTLIEKYKSILIDESRYLNG